VNRLRLRRALLVLCPLAAIWAVFVSLSEGFRLEIGSMRILSSRSAQNPALIAIMSGLAAWALTPPGDRRRLLLASGSWVARVWHRVGAYVGHLERWAIRLAGQLRANIEQSAPVRLAATLPPGLAPLLAGCAAVAVVAVGQLRGAPYAGGSDAYGYVSEAHLWATGTLRVEQPFVRDVKWPFAADAFTPLAYRPTADGTAIVPIYAPGLPMLMAIFERLAGRAAVFYVVPLMGGLAIWATYAMGSRFGGRTVGASAAILLATSPAFLFQLMLPTSDVPATAWWALSLTLLMVEGRGAALASGLAAGAAILTRPNLVPLAVIPGVLLLWRAARARDMAGPAGHHSEASQGAQAFQRVILFAAGAIPACLIVGIINARLWGSPLATGYERLDVQYQWRHVVPNLERYPRWLLNTQTPAILLALLAPFMAARRSPRYRSVTSMLACFITAVFVIYLFHQPNDAWFWLRYLLPAFPPLFVLMSAGLAVTLARVPRGVRLMATGVVLALLAWHGVVYGLNDGIFRFREGERKSRAIGEYIANSLPDRAVFISKLHSGSIRYYSGRLTLQYERIPPKALDSVVADLRGLGYQPYIVLEDWEEPLFVKLFRRQSALGALDWPPRVLLDHSTKVRIYDPADRQIPAAARAATTIIR
jgi:hypothetical protein